MILLGTSFGKLRTRTPISLVKEAAAQILEAPRGGAGWIAYDSAGHLFQDAAVSLENQCLSVRSGRLLIKIGNLLGRTAYDR
jgi:hypothetical protein